MINTEGINETESEAPADIDRQVWRQNWREFLQSEIMGTDKGTHEELSKIAGMSDQKIEKIALDRLGIKTDQGEIIEFYRPAKAVAESEKKPEAA